MKLLKMLFGSRKPALNKPVVSGSLSFKEQMVNDIIPFVERMIEKEKNHLYWLESVKAPKEFIERSEWHLNHFRQIHKEYIDYADGL
jgi:CTP:phosphocholine cytidylyltransferase-like protein